jgi:hypothetical protein
VEQTYFEERFAVQESGEALAGRDPYQEALVEGLLDPGSPMKLQSWPARSTSPLTTMP